jgi:hypothetical protein
MATAGCRSKVQSKLLNDHGGSMVSYAGEFGEYLGKVKKMARNSVTAYLRDLNEFENFIGRRGIGDIRDGFSTLRNKQ